MAEQSNIERVILRPRDAQTHAIIGAAMAVHAELGRGFLEAVYQEAFALECRLRAIPCLREVELPIHYKGDLLQCRYRVDFICYETILVELKAINELSGPGIAQVINYLKATGLKRALLINFGGNSLEYKRFVGPKMME